MIFLGIDPGVSGALAFYEDGALEVRDMPTLKLGGKSRVDAYALAQILDAKAILPSLCIMEQVAARPGAGVSGMFNFGRSFGVVEGVVSAQFWPLEFVMPHVWKREMQCPKDKDGARARASQLLPTHAHNWLLKKHDGRAEASLLALYAERRFRFRAVSP